MLTLGVAVPVLVAAAIGAAAGALWLHYRGPATDSRRHRLLAQPALAVSLAALLLVGVALLQLYLSRWAALATLLVLDVIALIWLRVLIHVGLLEEQAEIVVSTGEPCPNCGRTVPRGAFCSYCGVAVRALPKSARGHGRVGRRWLIARFAVGVAVLVGAAAVVMAAVAPAAYHSPCDRPGVPCASPPQLPGTARAPDYRAWGSAGGLRVIYDARAWRVVQTSANQLELIFFERPRAYDRDQRNHRQQRRAGAGRRARLSPRALSRSRARPVAFTRLRRRRTGERDRRSVCGSRRG